MVIPLFYQEASETIQNGLILLWMQKSPAAAHMGVQQGIIVYFLSNGFKVGSAVLTQRAYNVIRQLFTLVNPAAHLAYKAFLSLGLGLGLHILLVVCIGHGFRVRHHSCFRHRTDEHTMGSQIDVVLNL